LETGERHGDASPERRRNGANVFGSARARCHSCFETDYASFIAWRNWNCSDPTVDNFFAVAALWAADGAYLIGEMGPYTAGAGRLYFRVARQIHRQSMTAAHSICSTI
jgi:hypothetical protein